MGTPGKPLPWWRQGKALMEHKGNFLRFPSLPKSRPGGADFTVRLRGRRIIVLMVSLRVLLQLTNSFLSPGTAVTHGQG